MATKDITETVDGTNFNGISDRKIALITGITGQVIYNYTIFLITKYLYSQL